MVSMQMNICQVLSIKILTHESAEINSKIDMSGGGFEGKSNDIVYSDIVYSDIVYSDIVYSDNAEYNYGSLSELYNNTDLSQYLASGITAIYYYDLSRFDDKTISEMISNGAIPDINTPHGKRYNFS
jgi:hypothetical protein